MVRAAGSRSGGPAYLPVLDGLRAVSIGLVVLSHLGLGHVVPGAFGVTLFFFISGFLITRQLVDLLARRGRLDLGSFYARRALRLMPAAAAYIALAGLSFTLAGGAISRSGWAAALFYGANFYDIWAGYHSTLADVRHPFNILWSLAIEEHFYLVWPVALAAVWRAHGHRALVLMLMVCAAVLLWRLWIWQACFTPGAPWVCGPTNPTPLWRYNRLYLGTDTRLDSIAWGAVLALLSRSLLGGVPSAGVGAALLLSSFALPGALGRHVLRPTLQGIALLGLVAWLLESDGVVQRALRCGPALMVGRLSYSLYLWHWAALGAADFCFQGARGPGWVIMGCTLAAGLSCISYWGIERPMLRWRRRFGSHAVLA